MNRSNTALAGQKFVLASAKKMLLQEKPLYCSCIEVVKLHIIGLQQLNIFIVESGFSNHADSRLIVESYVWGRGKIHYKKSSSQTFNSHKY